MKQINLFGKKYATLNKTKEAESKKEALKKYNNLFCTNYRMTSKDKAIGRERIEIVTVSDYRNYNFSKFSYAI